MQKHIYGVFVRCCIDQFCRLAVFMYAGSSIQTQNILQLTVYTVYLTFSFILTLYYYAIWYINHPSLHLHHFILINLPEILKMIEYNINENNISSFEASSFMSIWMQLNFRFHFLGWVW